MSYVHMDHAGWVQSNLEAAKRCGFTKADERKARDHSRGWAAAPDQLNDFHKRAFTILGIVGGGIYNAPIAWDGIYWRADAIGVSWYKTFATYDFRDLTRFVFLCHEARIRGEISPLNMRHLRVMLHERRPADEMARNHPSLDEALAQWRNEFPADHQLVYRAPTAEAAE